MVPPSRPPGAIAVIALWWGLLALSRRSPATSSPAPSRRHAFVHGRAHWRLLVPRESQRPAAAGGRLRVDDGPRRAGGPTGLASRSSGDEGAIDKVARTLGVDQLFDRKSPTVAAKSTDPERARGRVVRTAARPRQPSGGSLPSSRDYTTRKPSLPLISVAEAGVSGDYNHYRTAALASTPDRAISILTRDVGAYIQSLDGGHFARKGGGYQDGDLGENVLVDGVDFDFFAPGGRYRFAPPGREGGGSEEDVVVEITERMEPCANLCKLPYINHPSDAPKERIGRCQSLLAALGKKDGLRGWYARVVKGGIIRVGDVAAIA